MSRGLREFFTEHGKWSEATFGTTAERGPEGTLIHLAKETIEAAEKPYDIMEYSDMLLLLCDSTRRAGFTCDQLMDAAWRKLEICKTRQWPKAVDGQPVEHIE